MQIKKNFTKSGLYILSSKLCKYANEKWIIIKINNLLLIKNYLTPKIWQILLISLWEFKS